jgi:hypothetical protein
MALIDTIRSALASAEDSMVGSEREVLPPQTGSKTKTGAGRGRKPGKPVPAKPASVAQKKPPASTPNKTDVVLKKLRLAKGASIAQLVDATGWQAHSVRGFLSAVIRKKLGLALVSEVGKDGIRRYRIEDEAAAVKNGGAG